jgi:hypothetical protein
VNVVVLAEEFGGEGLSPAGLWLDELARSWEARGHQMLIVCSRPHPQGDSSQITFRRGIKVWHPGPDRFEEALGEALAEPIDVVHVMGDGPYGARVLEAFRELPGPMSTTSADLPGQRSAPPPAPRRGEHFPYSAAAGARGPPPARDGRAQRAGRDRRAPSSSTRR